MFPFIFILLFAEFIFVYILRRSSSNYGHEDFMSDLTPYSPILQLSNILYIEIYLDLYSSSTAYQI